MSWVGFSLASPITRRTAFTCVIFTGDLKNFETVGEPTEYYLVSLVIQIIIADSLKIIILSRDPPDVSSGHETLFRGFLSFDFELER